MGREWRGRVKGTRLRRGGASVRLGPDTRPAPILARLEDEAVLVMPDLASVRRVRRISYCCCNVLICVLAYCVCVACVALHPLTFDICSDWIRRPDRIRPGNMPPRSPCDRPPPRTPGILCPASRLFQSSAPGSVGRAPVAAAATGGGEVRGCPSPIL